MTERLRSVRFRLTATFILVFGVLQAGLWGMVDAMRTGYISTSFDQRLIEQGQTAVQVLDAELKRGRSLEDAAGLRQVLEPLQGPDVYLQVRAADGRVACQSANLAGTEIPFDPALATSHEETPRLETLKGKAVNRLVGEGELRNVTLAHRAPAGGNYYVSVAASLEPVDHIVTEMRQLLTLFGFVSVAIAGLTTWYLARRSLAPIDTVARRAKLLGAAHLAERIPVPQHQDEVSEMVVVLNEMLDRLESAFRNQQRFFGEASHELKTPLAVLLAEAQAIARRPFDREESVRFAHSVEGEVRKLLRIVESFLILSRAQPGQRPAVVADVLVEDAVLEAIHRCRVETSQRRVCVIPTFTTGDSMPAPVIAGDFELICSMIESLLFNAVRNSPSGSNVDIDVRSDDGAVEISVRDAGPAVPEREWEQLFKVFYQAPGARAPGRSGIGLSIVKAVAELHGGTVRVRNLSAGCELTVCVPTRQEALPSE